MSSINGEHLFVNANAFRDWAKEQVDNKHEDTVLALTKTGVDGAQEARKILQADATDLSKSVEHLMENNAGGTKAQRKLANAEARKIFLSFIKQSCGLKDNASLDQLPENVRRAMKLTGIFHKNDWFEGSSRPLTARRINAVMEALDNFQKDMMSGKAFHPTSKFGKYYKSQWNTEPSGDIIALLNNVSSETLEKMAKPLAMLGTNVSKRQVVLVLSKQELIEGLMKEKKLTPSALFKAMYEEPSYEFTKEELKIPEYLLAAEKKGDKNAVAEAFHKYDIDEQNMAIDKVKDSTDPIKTRKRQSMVRFMMQISSQSPDYIANCILQGKPYNEKEGDVRLNKLLAPVTSTKGTPESVIGSLARQTTGGRDISITFLDRTGGDKSMQMTFKQMPQTDQNDLDSSNIKEQKEKIEEQNKKAKKALEKQVNTFFNGVNYNKGMLYSSLTSDHGINRLVRQIGIAKTGILGISSLEGTNYTIEKRSSDVIKVTIASRKGAVRNLGNDGPHKADFKLSVLLYPDGRQEVINPSTKVNYEKLEGEHSNFLGEPVEVPENCPKLEFYLKEGASVG